MGNRAAVLEPQGVGGSEQATADAAFAERQYPIVHFAKACSLTKACRQLLERQYPIVRLRVYAGHANHDQGSPSHSRHGFACSGSGTGYGRTWLVWLLLSHPWRLIAAAALAGYGRRRGSVCVALARRSRRRTRRTAVAGMAPRPLPGLCGSRLQAVRIVHLRRSLLSLSPRLAVGFASISPRGACRPRQTRCLKWNRDSAELLRAMRCDSNGWHGEKWNRLR